MNIPIWIWYIVGAAVEAKKTISKAEWLRWANAEAILVNDPQGEHWALVFGRLANAAGFAARQFNGLVLVFQQHREEWLCAGPGQWPDEFTLLNRYVRTGAVPSYILNE